MGEIERRRRRLRPPSAAPVPGPPPGGPPASAPPGGGKPVGDPPGGVPVAPSDGAVTASIEDPVEDAPRPARPGGPGRPARVARPASGAGGDDSERGLRGLVGSGSSQVSVGAALRARDAARPGEEQIAEAEAHLPIVRRNWTPREDLPRR